jgi:transcriptional regulator with XRE-family HTH domain
MIHNIFRAVIAGRNALNLSQNQLAELSGLNRTTINKIESGDLVVKLKSINAVFDVFEKMGLEFTFSNNSMSFNINFKEGQNVRQH